MLDLVIVPIIMGLLKGHDFQVHRQMFGAVIYEKVAKLFFSHYKQVAIQLERLMNPLQIFGNAASITIFFSVDIKKGSYYSDTVHFNNLNLKDIFIYIFCKSCFFLAI